MVRRRSPHDTNHEEVEPYRVKKESDVSVNVVGITTTIGLKPIMTLDQKFNVSDRDAKLPTLMIYYSRYALIRTGTRVLLPNIYTMRIRKRIDSRTTAT